MALIKCDGGFEGELRRYVLFEIAGLCLNFLFIDIEGSSISSKSIPKTFEVGLFNFRSKFELLEWDELLFSKLINA